MERGKPVLLRWQDSAGLSGWKYGAKLEGGIVEIQSLGFVTNNNAEYLTITHALDEEQVGGYAPLSIPWGCITELVEIKLPWDLTATNCTMEKSA